MSRLAHNRLKLTGQRFGRLVVLAEAGDHQCPTGAKSLWHCQCDCGAKCDVYGSSLTSGNTRSCGCLRLDLQSERSAKHRQAGTRTYRIWQAMLNRCRNENTPQYQDYGGRGIKVCPEWASFDAFFRDMGEAPYGHSIDRIDVNGNYEPENCRWATHREQCRNKRNNRLITFNGETKCLMDWAQQLGMDQASLAERLQKWPLEKAMTTPKRRAA